MRYPKKTYPKAFSVLFGILAAAFILFLIWLGVQPAEPSKLSQTEDSQSDFASVSDPPHPGRRAMTRFPSLTPFWSRRQMINRWIPLLIG